MFSGFTGVFWDVLECSHDVLERSRVALGGSDDVLRCIRSAGSEVLGMFWAALGMYLADLGMFWAELAIFLRCWRDVLQMSRDVLGMFWDVRRTSPSVYLHVCAGRGVGPDVDARRI